MEVFYSSSEAETEEIGRRVAGFVTEGDFICLYGEMGSGKTVFMRGFVHARIPEALVSSPTYAILNVYDNDSGECINHFDMYRINTFDDLYSTGFFDYLDSGAVLVIEWSENIIDFIGDEKIITVEIKRLGDSEREITVERGE